ncbi:conserved membrane hypothetical protein [Hyella patelloides LEGE 07179]|uniref:Glycosyltransferase RgtA/B/C/D-like domain-containing protein n=2 Tax=Hyella TaxID=945733 RepID=A0A563VWS9_9CYAN|nr:conserved membrane hypothetical protein [Hyella patelloides LEGE 07179]
MVFAYNPQRAIAESLSLGIFLSFVLISLIFQTAFLLEIPNLAILLEAILVLLTVKYLLDHRLVLIKAVKSIGKFIKAHKIIAGIVIVCWVYLFFLVAIIPPSNWDSMTYNLSRVFLFQQEKSLFLENVTNIRQGMLVMGADILNHGFLRLNQDYGVGIFSWLAYISVCLGTYGLSRNFASKKVSIATALIITSLTEFCFQATSTKNDIFTAASAIFCFIVADRLLAQPNVKNVALLLLGLAYGFSAKTTFVAFMGPFGLGFLALALWKIGWKKLYQIIAHNWLYFLILTAPILIISQSWLFMHNTVTAQDPTGGATIRIVRQSNNMIYDVIGGVGNLVRYFFQSIHLFPLDYIARGRLNFDLAEYFTNIYNQIFQPIFRAHGMGYVGSKPYMFQLKSLPHEDFSWYGPFAVTIILPAIFWSLIRGNYWLKVQSLSLLGFMFIVSFKLVWTPWTNRYVVLFFAASGACVAFMLQQIPSKYQSKILNGIIAISLFLLISASVLNVSKPLGGLSITEFFKPNIWSRTELGGDRLYYARKRYKDDRVEKFRDLVTPGSKVALLANEKTWIYHFYLVNPQVAIVPTSLTEFKNNSQVYDYLLCLNTECNLNDIGTTHKLLWKSSTESARQGKLIKLKT